MIYIAFNKPYGVLSQFTPRDGHSSLKDFNFPPDIYPCGRLDFDSEGLLLLSNDGIFNQKITNPSSQKSKTYYAQVEKEISQEALNSLLNGIMLKDGPAKAIYAKKTSLTLPPRNPPIRQRKTIPTSWVEIKITEGRNRQVRRMLAATGFPVLRLIRFAIGEITLEGLKLGEQRRLTLEEIKKYFS